MKKYSKVSDKKETALLQQSLLCSSDDIVANFLPSAKHMGIGIAFTTNKKIVISRWKFSREFTDANSAVQFLVEMGVAT
jgi:hypothetical protein